MKIRMWTLVSSIQHTVDVWTEFLSNVSQNNLLDMQIIIKEIKYAYKSIKCFHLHIYLNKNIISFVQNNNMFVK